jgi:hypothetical protein
MSPVQVTDPAPDPGEERKTLTPGLWRVRRPGRLAAENEAAGTIRIYTDAARWFAASHLLAETDKTRWEQVDAPDVRRWVTRRVARTWTWRRARSGSGARAAASGR